MARVTPDQLEAIFDKLTDDNAALAKRARASKPGEMLHRCFEGACETINASRDRGRN